VKIAAVIVGVYEPAAANFRVTAAQQAEQSVSKWCMLQTVLG
jgi:hypothetical protein